MESHKRCYPREFSFEDFGRFTNGFSRENFIGETQFGKVYRGKILQDQNGMEAQEVTVKIWVDREIYFVKPGEKIVRAREEVSFLQQRNMMSHPNLVKLIGYCFEDKQVGVVYDLKSLDTVYNLVFEESFTWMQRIKVAVEFARLVDFLHNEKGNSLGYLVRNISPAHIMLDQDFSPILFDFGMLSGGILPDKRDIEDEKQWGCYGYMDPSYAMPDQTIGIFLSVCCHPHVLVQFMEARRLQDGEELKILEFSHKDSFFHNLKLEEPSRVHKFIMITQASQGVHISVYTGTVWGQDIWM